MLGSDQPLLRVVSQSNLKGTTEGVYYQAPDVLLDAVTIRRHVHTEPFYWRLPGQFQGDQVRRAPSLQPSTFSGCTLKSQWPGLAYCSLE